MKSYFVIIRFSIFNGKLKFGIFRFLCCFPSDVLNTMEGEPETNNSKKEVS